MRKLIFILIIGTILFSSCTDGYQSGKNSKSKISNIANQYSLDTNAKVIPMVYVRDKTPELVCRDYYFEVMPNGTRILYNSYGVNATAGGDGDVDYSISGFFYWVSLFVIFALGFLIGIPVGENQK